MQVLEEYAKARLTRDVADFYGQSYPSGFEFEVSEYLPALPPGDPNRSDPDYIKEAAYYGNANGGFNNVCVPAEAVELVMSAEQMRNRRPPSVQELLDAIQGELCGMDGDTFTINEAENDKRATVTISGETEDGYTFGVNLQIMAIYATDF